MFWVFLWVWIHYTLPKPVGGMSSCNNFSKRQQPDKSGWQNTTFSSQATKPGGCWTGECLLLCLAWIKPSMATRYCQHINHYTNIYPCLLGPVLGVVVQKRHPFTLSNLPSSQSAFEAPKSIRNATLLQKAWSTTMKPTKTAFPREEPWPSPGTRTKSAPSVTIVKRVCQASTTFGWA